MTDEQMDREQAEQSLRDFVMLSALDRLARAVVPPQRSAREAQTA